MKNKISLFENLEGKRIAFAFTWAGIKYLALIGLVSFTAGLALLFSGFSTPGEKQIAFNKASLEAGRVI